MNILNPNNCEHKNKFVLESSIGREMFICKDCKVSYMVMKEHLHSWSRIEQQEASDWVPGISDQTREAQWMCEHCSLVVAGPIYMSPPVDLSLKDVQVVNDSPENE